MANLTPQKKIANDFNYGVEFINTDTPQASDFNNVIESQLYSQNFAEYMADTPDTTQAGNVGTPTVELIDNIKDGTTYKKFKFSNLKGEQGIPPEISQTTGQSTTIVMSQKAVTDELSLKADKSDTYTKAEVDEKIDIDLDVVNKNLTSGTFINIPNTPKTKIEPTDYNTILNHKRLYNNSLYNEGDTVLPIPTPTTPLFIVTSNGKSKMNITGKNLSGNLDEGLNSAFTKSGNNYRVTRLSSVRISNSINCFIPANTRFVFSANRIGGSEPVSLFGVLFYFSDGTGTTHSLYGGNVQFYLKPIIKYSIFVAAEAEVGSYTEFNNFQIELKSTNGGTTYAPYQSSTKTFEFKAVDNTKQYLIDDAITLGDFASEIKGNKAIIYTAKRTFNGTENWEYRSQEPDFILTNAFTDANSIKLARDSALCNYFTINTYSGVVVDKTFQIWSNGTTLGVMNFDYTDTTSFKSWLAGLSSSGNPLSIYYVLATPIEIEIEQLDSIQTYSDGTVLYTEDIGVTNAQTILDFTDYQIENTDKVYGTLVDKEDNIIIPYTQSNMLKDTNTNEYFSTLLNLKSPDGSNWKITVSNAGVITATKL